MEVRRGLFRLKNGSDFEKRKRRVGRQVEMMRTAKKKAVGPRTTESLFKPSRTACPLFQKRFEIAEPRTPPERAQNMIQRLNPNKPKNESPLFGSGSV